MLNKFRDKLKDMSKNGVTIPIKPMMLEKLMKRQEDLKELKVEITSEHLIIRGNTGAEDRTGGNPISFEAALKPVHMEKRVIVFEVSQVKPADLKLTDINIFNQPPFAQSSTRTVKIDFNSWDIVSKIPVGKIKHYEMTNGAIQVTLSL